MKKILYIMCMCVLALGLLSGCGGEFVEEMEAGEDASRALTGSAVSEHNVSGPAVSGQSVSGQAIQTDGEEADSAREDSRGVFDSRYCTEQYYYTSLYDDNKEGSYIVQISLETGNEKQIGVKELDRLVYVEKDALYYTRSVDDEEEYYGLWRLPIERREDGTEKLNLDRTEQVKGLDDIYYEDDAIYMDDQYIIYSGLKGNEEDTDVICYDRESGRKESLPASDRGQDCLEYDIESIYRRNDRIDLVTTDGIVTWDVRTGDVTVCGDDVLDDEDLVSTEDVCFYTKGDDQLAILRIDMKTKEKTDFVKEEELLATLEKEVGISKKQMDKKGSWVYSVYYDEHHLYMELRVSYEKEGKNGFQNIILSREDAEGASLQYEKGLTEYLWDGNGTKDLNTEWGFLSSNASCYGISRGRAYIKWWSEDDRVWDDIIYDLKTGKTRPVSWKDDLMFR